MAIAYVNSALKQQITPSTTNSTLYTVGAAPETGLVFFVVTPIGVQATGLTVGTRDAILVGTFPLILGFIVAFRMENPPTGAQTVTATLSGSAESHLNILEYTGVDHNSMIGATASASYFPPNQDFAVSITPVSNSAWIVSCVMTQGDSSDTFTTDPPAVIRTTNTPTSGSGGAAIAEATGDSNGASASGNTFHLYPNTTVVRNIVSLEIKSPGPRNIGGGAIYYGGYAQY